MSTGPAGTIASVASAAVATAAGASSQLHVRVDAPLVTIMIPTYGQEALLPRALEGALAQDHRPLEVLVGDDASPDGTANVTARYGSDPRIRYVRQERNLGRVANYRDLLYVRARGEFVLNLDGDDWLIDPSYVREAAAILTADPEVVLVFARAWSFDENTGRYGQAAGRNRNLDRVLDGDGVFLAHASGAVSIPHLTALYRRKDAMEIGFYGRDLVGADTESLLRLIQGRRVGFVDREVAVWRQHAHNASRAADVRARLMNLAAIDVPYRHARGVGAFDRATLERWRHRMSVQRSRAYLLDRLQARDAASAARFLMMLAVTRPRVAASVAGALGTRLAEHLVGRRRPILVDRV